jgi:hypothetical protein
MKTMALLLFTQCTGDRSAMAHRSRDDRRIEWTCNSFGLQRKAALQSELRWLPTAHLLPTKAGEAAPHPLALLRLQGVVLRRTLGERAKLSPIFTARYRGAWKLLNMFNYSFGTDFAS